MIIYVKVIVNANEEKIIKLAEGYKIYLKQRAEKGKANEELIKIIAREFNCSVKQILIKNPKSRNKIIEIVGVQ